MTDRRPDEAGPNGSGQDIDTGPPIEQLQNHAVEPDPDLTGRVRRSINRHLLAADSVEFSLSVLMKTAWSYLEALLEAWPLGSKERTKE